MNFIVLAHILGFGKVVRVIGVKFESCVCCIHRMTDNIKQMNFFPPKVGRIKKCMRTFLRHTDGNLRSMMVFLKAFCS